MMCRVHETIYLVMTCELTNTCLYALRDACSSSVTDCSNLWSAAQPPLTSLFFSLNLTSQPHEDPTPEHDYGQLLIAKR